MRISSHLYTLTSISWRFVTLSVVSRSLHQIFQTYQRMLLRISMQTVLSALVLRSLPVISSSVRLHLRVRAIHRLRRSCCVLSLVTRLVTLRMLRSRHSPHCTVLSSTLSSIATLRRMASVTEHRRRLSWSSSMQSTQRRLQSSPRHWCQSSGACWRARPLLAFTTTTT